MAATCTSSHGPVSVWDAMVSASDAEKACIEKLKDALAEKAQKEGVDLSQLDPNFPLVDFTYLRFARARKLDVQNACDLLFACIQWRLKHLPHLIDEYWAAYALQKGEVIEHGKDIDGNHVCWFFPERHLNFSGKLEIYARGVVFLTERILRKVLYPTGKRTTLIWDIKNLGMSNIDYGFLKYIIDCFSTIYPETLARILIVDSPWFFTPIWKVVKPWVDPVTASKIIFCSRSELSKYIALDQVPKDWGGTEDWKWAWTPETPDLIVPKTLNDYDLNDPRITSRLTS